MKISAKSRYALRILLDLALFGSKDKPRTVREISQSQKISASFISRIIIDLRRAKFLKTGRGVHGGIILTEDPKKISVLRIIESVEGKFHLLSCLGNKKCRRAGDCAVNMFWKEIDDLMIQAMSNATIDRMVEEYWKCHSNDEEGKKSMLCATKK